MTWESSFFDTISIELMRRQICEFRQEFTLCSYASYVSYVFQSYCRLISNKKNLPRDGYWLVRHHRTILTSLPGHFPSLPLRLV